MDPQPVLGSKVGIPSRRRESNAYLCLVDPAIARNCININPCQQDTTIIRDAEINSNVVNQCGRTQLSGNIDVGENTENALAAGAVTQVQSGTELTVTIHQVNADGAGPYSCDLDETSNTSVISQVRTVKIRLPRGELTWLEESVCSE